MATNLRLRPDAADAVRREAERTGRSQQDVIREAVDQLLGRVPAGSADDPAGVYITAGTVPPPRTAYRSPAKRLNLPSDLKSADLLDREERF